MNSFTYKVLIFYNLENRKTKLPFTSKDKVSMFKFIG